MHKAIKEFGWTPIYYIYGYYERLNMAYFLCMSGVPFLLLDDILDSLLNDYDPITVIEAG